MSDLIKLQKYIAFIIFLFHFSVSAIFSTLHPSLYKPYYDIFHPDVVSFVEWLHSCKMHFNKPK